MYYVNNNNFIYLQPLTNLSKFGDLTMENLRKQFLAISLVFLMLLGPVTVGY